MVSIQSFTHGISPAPRSDPLVVSRQGCQLGPLCSMTRSPPRTPGSGPQSQSLLGAQRPHSRSRVPRPLLGDPAWWLTRVVCTGERGAFCSPTAREAPERPNPLITVHRRRDQFPHGREESPQCGRGRTERRFSSAARQHFAHELPSPPLSLVFSLSRPATLLAGLLRGCFLDCFSLSSFLPACVCVSPASSPSLSGCPL